MRDDETMASALSAQLEGLRREQARLEDLLMLDANWRALRQLEQREAAGEPLVAVDGQGLKADLVAALGTNRIFAARAKLLETIELLAADLPARAGSAGTGSLSSRIVMLSEPDGETFRARLRMKLRVPEIDAGGFAEPEEASRARPEPRASHGAAPARADALELIDGLRRPAVERLIEGGVTGYAQIAAWTNVEVAHWRARLDGIADGAAGSWIEQAAILAAGHSTRFSERARRGEFAALVPSPDPEPPAPRRDGIAFSAVAGEVAAHAPTPRMPPPLPSQADAASPMVSAEDLVREFAAVALVPAPPEVMIAAAEDGPSGAVPAERSGYVRPQHRPPEADTDESAEVVAVPTVDPSTGDRPRGLIRRLKDIRFADRFAAEQYAAYRGSVEEASVTIVAQSTVARATERTVEPKDGEPRPSNRFLRALTGRG
jgi:predicted flap endonuclease-1-like 5' DNA nuclease